MKHADGGASQAALALEREPAAQVDECDICGVENTGLRAVVNQAVDVSGIRACRVLAAATFVADVLQEPVSGIEQSGRSWHPPIVARLVACACTARGSPS